MNILHQSVRLGLSSAACEGCSKWLEDEAWPVSARMSSTCWPPVSLEVTFRSLQHPGAGSDHLQTVLKGESEFIDGSQTRPYFSYPKDLN